MTQNDPLHKIMKDNGTHDESTPRASHLKADPALFGKHPPQ